MWHLIYMLSCCSINIKFSLYILPNGYKVVPNNFRTKRFSLNSNNWIHSCSYIYFVLLFAYPRYPIHEIRKLEKQTNKQIWPFISTWTNIYMHDSTRAHKYSCPMHSVKKMDVQSLSFRIIQWYDKIFISFLFVFANLFLK